MGCDASVQSRSDVYGVEMVLGTDSSNTCFTREGRRVIGRATIRCVAHNLSAMEPGRICIITICTIFSTHNVLRHIRFDDFALSHSAIQRRIQTDQSSQDAFAMVIQVHALYKSFMPHALYIQRADSNLVLRSIRDQHVNSTAGLAAQT